ncbi:MAG: fibro-slime domain-containing protein [Planctomycetota bacterium]|jgi:fibro-slime domain-containing protein
MSNRITNPLGTLSLAGILSLLPLAQAAAQEDPQESPETIEVMGVVRDFQESSAPGGHPDFENMPDHGFGRYSGNIGLTISDEGKPVFTGNGRKVAQQWRDFMNREICYCLYDPDRGDIEGQWSQPSNAGINSASSFDQWFRDVPVYNLSAPLTLTLVRRDNGMYVFDDQEDPYYADLGGFFPIDGELFGNSGGQGQGNQDHNYHFTFELRGQFTYDAEAGHSFRFVGTDDVWLFIDGRLVNDLIGVHASHDQFVEVDRLGLEDGETYTLDFFFAQRFRPQSHFRIETNMLLETVPVHTVSAVFD